MRSEVWAGDLIAAWAALGRRPEDLAPLGALLLGDEGAATPATTSAGDRDARRGPARPPVVDVPAPPSPPPTPAPAPPAAAAPTQPTRVTSLSAEPMPGASTSLAPPPWLLGRRVAAAAAAPPPMRLQPLFPHGSARATVAALAHSVRRTGEYDLEHAVRLIAERRPAGALRPRKVRTTSAGLQLVVDRTWAMRPFADDVAVLRRQLVAVVGRDRIDELWFDGALDRCHLPPQAGGRAAREAARRRRRWQPPDGGVPVVVVSDLGRADAARGDGGTAAAWRALMAEARAYGCEVIALVPRRVGAADRAPEATAVAWDTRTTAGAVITDRARSRG